MDAATGFHRTPGTAGAHPIMQKDYAAQLSKTQVGRREQRGGWGGCVSRRAAQLSKTQVEKEGKKEGSLQ